MVVAAVPVRKSARRAKRALFVEPEPTKKPINAWTPEEDERLRAALGAEPPLSWIQVAQAVGTRNDSMCRSRARRTEGRKPRFQDHDTPPTSPPTSPLPSPLPSPLLDMCPSSPLADSFDTFMLDMSEDLEPPLDGLIAVEKLPDEPPPPKFRVGISKGGTVTKTPEGPILQLALKAKLGFFNSPGLSLSHKDLWGFDTWRRIPNRPAKVVTTMPTKITDYWARKRLRTSASKAYPKQLPGPKPTAPTVYLEKASSELEPVPNYLAADPKTEGVMRARANL